MIIKPATVREPSRPRFEPSHGPHTTRLVFNKHTTDCTGVFNVMAIQVRPGSIQPKVFTGHQKSAVVIRKSISKFHQGPRLVPHTEAECMAAISTCEPEPMNTLVNEGASMYEDLPGCASITSTAYRREAPESAKIG